MIRVINIQLPSDHVQWHWFLYFLMVLLHLKVWQNAMTWFSLFS
jgi:hypothetical protein